MGSVASRPVPEPPSRVGPYRVVRVLRTDGVDGCALGADPSGREVLLRWTSRASEGRTTPRADVEHAALQDVADLAAPQPLDLLWLPDRVVSVSEWVRGASPVTPERLGDPRVATELVRVLRRIHAAGWIHGDLKPSNLLFRRSGALVLTDWELASRQGDPCAPGTPGWAPAEALSGTPLAAPWFDVHSASRILEGCAGADVEELRACASRKSPLVGADAPAPRACTRRVRRFFLAQTLRVAAHGLDAIGTGDHVECSLPTEIVASIEDVTDRIAERLRRERELTVVTWMQLARWGAALVRSGRPGTIHELVSSYADVGETVVLCAGPGAPGRARAVSERIESVIVGAGLRNVRCVRIALRIADADPETVRDAETRTRLACAVPMSGCVRGELRPRFHCGGSPRELEGAATANPGLWAQRAVSALAAGDLDVAYRACVRAHTEIVGGAAATPADLRNLAFAWSDQGRDEAAEVVACLAPSPLRERLLVTVLAAHGELVRLGDVVPALEAASTDPEMLVCGVRAKILAAFRRGDDRRSLRRLRVRRDVRRSAPVRARLEYALTRAMVARLASHLSLARRLLGACGRDATASGWMRLALASESTRLLCTETEAPFALATAWLAIARSGAAWRLAALSRSSRALAARLLVEARDYHGARRVLGDLDAESVESADSRPRDMRTADIARLACAERFDELPVLLARVGARDCGAELRWAADAADYEVRGALASSVATSSQGAVDAARSIASRAAGRPQIREFSLVRLVSAICRRTPTGSGLDVAAIRPFIDRPCAAAAWPAAIRVLRGRCGSGPDDFEEATVLGYVALCLCAGVSLPDDVVRWFVVEAPPQVASRPVGVRAWEWRLALGLACAQLGLAFPGEPDWDRACADDLAALLRQLSPRDRRRYVERILASRGAGGGRGDVDLLARTVVSVASGGRNVRAAGRTHAIERLLTSALKLRSAAGLDDVLAETVRGLLDVTLADRAVVLFEAADGRTAARVGTPEGVATLALEDAEVSHSVLTRVRDAKGVVVLDDVSADADLLDRPSVRRYKPRAVMACPLRTQSRYLGYIYVESRSRAGCFADFEREMMEGFAAQAALALENAALVEDLRRSYRDLATARSEAVRAEGLRALGRLASEIAHDLNNLLTCILGETQLLLTDSRMHGARTSLRVIERAAEDGAECIRRMQASTRAAKEGEFSDVDTGGVVDDVIRLVRAREPRLGGDGPDAVRLECEAQRGVVTIGNEPELREVLLNLVVNAVQAMPAGGTLRVVVRRRERNVLIDVADTGCGIPADVRKRLFEPFFSTKGAQGNGLGLSIARALVRKWGGDIDVESEVGVGTTMTVRLPLAWSDALVRDLPPALPPARPGQRPRCLIVDDDPSVLRVLGPMVEQAGIEAVSAVGGDEAISRVESDEAGFDCVITDLYMPRVSGLDVIDRVRAVRPAARVVVMSGCNTTLESAAVQSRGVERILRKPFTLDGVRQAVAASTPRRADE